MDKRIGRVSLVEPYQLAVLFERGSAWYGPTYWRGSLRLLAKVAATAWSSATNCPF
jgi:hypothetical protein